MVVAKQDDTLVEKTRPGASWKEQEIHILPKNRLDIVYIGLMCTLFLSSLDQTIVATALPTIVEKLGGGNSYNWVGSAYMLSAGAFGPLYGKLSNMFGRKPILYSSVLIFLFGSAMCGAAQSMTWLIICRAIQGIGGGGMVQLVIIIISDIVPLKDRGLYAGFVGTMYGVASVTGPVVGGALAQHISWRWCFFINLPIGATAIGILFTFLNLNPHEKRPIGDQVAELDFIGLICLVAGVACLLIGLGFGQSTWLSTTTVVPLVLGTVLLLAGGVNEVFTKRSAIIPARLFKTRTTSIILITTFLHAVVHYSTVYYLPLYYQVLGATATNAGVEMITFSLGSAIASIVSGFIMSKTGRYRPLTWISYAVMTFGMGLMTLLSHTSNPIEQRIFPLVASLGLGCMFQIPLVALQAAMPLKDMATASSALLFLRMVGASVGIASGEAIIMGILPRKLANVSNFASLGLGTTVDELNNSISKMHLIPNVTLRNAILHAWTETIGTIWIAWASVTGFALILTLFLREYSLDRKVARDSDEAKTTNESPSDEQEHKASKSSNDGPDRPSPV